MASASHSNRTDSASAGPTSNLAIDAAFPETEARKTIDSLHKLFKDIPDDQKVEAIARAINLQAQDRFDAERQLYLQSFDYVKDIHSVILGFAKALDSHKLDPKSFKSLGLTFSVQHISDRRSEGYAQNPITNLFDRLFLDFSSKLARLVAPQEASKVYIQRAEPLCQDSTRNVPLVDKAKILEKLRENQRAYLEVVDNVEVMLRSFSGYCRSVADRVQTTHKKIMSQYGPEKPQNDEAQGPKSIFDLFDSPEPRQNRVPLYKDNPYLTAFLHDLSERIPVDFKSKDSEEAKSKRLAKDPEVAAFVNYLKAHCDGQIYTAINSTKVYEGISRCLTELGEGLQKIYVILKATSLDDLRKNDRINPRASYENVVKELEQQLHGEGEGNEAFESFRQFRLNDVLKLIESFESAPFDSKVEKQDKPKRAFSKREKAYLKLFETLDEFVQDYISGKVGNPEIEKFLKTVLPQKQDVDGHRVAHKDSLTRDIDKGNYAFDVVQGGYGDLELERVPTSTMTYNDIVGKSWDTVQEKLETLRDYAQFPHFYHDMTVRGKLNNNMLIVGPYGCGKNLFLKALMADPRIVGVNMTSDRIMSMWHSKSEANTRALFELARDKRIELDRPVVIGWDEFDSMFQRKNKGGFSSSSDIATRMQKILQSVLEGDTVYEGVALIGLTNEPEQIPMALWRRFAHVVVIQPLKEDERRSVIEHMLSGLPLAENFNKQADWEYFKQHTEDAGGDVIGKIFDRIYRKVRDHILEEHGTKAMQTIEEKVKAIKAEGGTLNQEVRAQIFREATNNQFEVTTDDFIKAVSFVTEEPDVKQAMRRQARFYHEIEKRFDDASMDDD